jgi:hypothetical protein
LNLDNTNDFEKLTGLYFLPPIFSYCVWAYVTYIKTWALLGLCVVLVQPMKTHKHSIYFMLEATMLQDKFQLSLTSISINFKIYPIFVSLFGSQNIDIASAFHRKVKRQPQFIIDRDSGVVSTSHKRTISKIHLYKFLKVNLKLRIPY